MSHGFDPGGTAYASSLNSTPPQLSRQPSHRLGSPSPAGFPHHAAGPLYAPYLDHSRPLEDRLAYGGAPVPQGQQQLLQSQSLSFAGAVATVPGAGSSRPPSRLAAGHSASVPTALTAMSLSASSLGGGQASYKSHSLLPNGHHPSQMGGVGTVATMSSLGGAGTLTGSGLSAAGLHHHHHPQHATLLPNSVSRLSHSFITTFPASSHHPHQNTHTRQSSLLLNADQNTTTQKDLSTTAPTSATGLAPHPGGSGDAGSAGAIAINSSLLTSTYHHALSLLCMLSVLMCVLSASVLRPLESTDVSTERALRDVLSVCLLVLSMCLDLHCLFVCSLQLMLALREGNSAYLKRASCSRNLAVCSFLLSVPFFLTGVILLLDIPLPASLAIIGVVFLVCIASSLHNVYVWHLVVQSGEASSNAKALNGHIVQLSTLV